MRSLPVIHARLRAGDRLFWAGKISDILMKWEGDVPLRAVSQQQLPQPLWWNNDRERFATCSWYEHAKALDTGSALEQDGQPTWEFSHSTVKHWAQFLGAVLNDLQAAIEAYQEIDTLDRVRPLANTKARTALEMVNRPIAVLNSLLSFKDVVKNLANLPSLKMLLAPFNETASILDLKENIADLRVAPGETGPELLMRYLQSIVAGQVAMSYFYDPKQRAMLRNVSIGLLRAFPTSTGSNTTGLESPEATIMPAFISLKELCSTYFERFPRRLEIRSRVVQTLSERHPGDRAEFRGRVHPEAILAALIDHYSTTDVNPTSNIRDNIDDLILEGSPLTKFMGQELDARLFPPSPVTLGRRSCFCCYEVCDMQTEERPDHVLPSLGTHGAIYPWDPPIGIISLETLKRVEDAL